MIQKFKMTTFAAVLCLFGLMLFTAAQAEHLNSSHKHPEFRHHVELAKCDAIEKDGGKKRGKRGRDCYKALAVEVIAITDEVFKVTTKGDARGLVSRYNVHDALGNLKGYDLCPGAQLGTLLNGECVAYKK